MLTVLAVEELVITEPQQAIDLHPGGRVCLCTSCTVSQFLEDQVKKAV